MINNNIINNRIKRGEIYWVNLPEIKNSSIQAGVHPCLIVQNDMGNKHSPNVHVCCISSKIFKKTMPTHVNLNKNNINNLTKDSVILVETTTIIPKNLLGDYKGKVEDSIMELVDNALSVQFGTEELFDENYIHKISIKIKKFHESYKKYQDNFFKQMRNEEINNFKNYCNKYKKDYNFYWNIYNQNNNTKENDKKVCLV